MDLQSFVSLCASSGDLIEISEPVDPHLGITRILSENQDKVVLFSNVSGYSYPIVGNVFSTRNRIARSLGVAEENLLPFLAQHFDKREKITEMTDFTMNEIDANSIPIPTYYEKDQGPYVTSGVVIAKDPITGVQNVSFHRMCHLGNGKFAIRIVPRHLFAYYKAAKEKGIPLDVVVCIGLPASVLLAASISCPPDVDELEIAAAMDQSLTFNKWKEIIFPKADFVLCGQLLHETTDEGPFVDITGTYDVVRKQPVIQIEKAYTTGAGLFQALLPGGFEHFYLMGMPKEPAIFHSVSAVVPRVHGVRLTPGGCCWLSGVVSISKQKEGDGKNAAIAALSGHASLKHVTIVDEDINIDDPHNIEWALATRFQGDKDLVMIKHARGSSLDPSLAEDGTTCKLGFDATCPLGQETEFVKARIP